MHIHSEKEKVPKANDNSSTEMSTTAGAGADVRLRRQQPVTIKPPRLRLGTRALSSHSQQQQSSHKRQQQLPQQRPSSWHPSHGVSKEAAGLNSEVKIGSPFESSNKNKKNGLAASGNVSDGARGTLASGGGPLIHHQRHNLKNRFQLLRTLGEGTYGKVKLAADRGTGEHVAIKYIRKTKIQDENDLVRIQREIKILSSLRHKHIVNIREVFEKKDKIVLVMDYAQGGELYDYLNKMGKLSEVEARRIFRQIVSALHYCHQNGIVHRDLKLENIILDDEGNVKIADFGLSNYFSHNSTLKTFCGSPLYASPEIVNGKPYHGPEVDVWSLGVILYTLVYGAMPFESNSLVSLKQQISDGDYNQPSKPSDAAGLIRHMLTVTPSRRATMEDALRHWWINFGNSHMPNGMPYSPDEEAPIMPYTLTADSHSMSTTPDPPVIIHHRNQSSISSDSDVELDFRPSRWSKRSMPLDSTGNSLSSSGACSPAPVADLCNISTDENDEPDDPAAIASALLKLPPDILRGCSSKTLAALLNMDKISTGFDLDNSNNDNRNNSLCQNTEGENREETAESEKTSSSVFDSERKPKRGILKRKGKFSGGDSGCIMPEEMTARPEENPIPKSGHLPRRFPSFKDEANGIFASKHRATQLLDNAASVQYESCSSAIAHSAWCSSPRSQRHQQHSQQKHQQQHHQQHQPRSHHPTASQHSQANNPSQQLPTGFSLPETVTVHSTDATIDLQNANLPAPQAMPNDTNNGIQSLQVTSKYDTSQSANSHSRDSSYDDGANEKPAKVIHRPKSILKNSKLSQMEEARNRLSVSSLGSNSSADFLDLSYDSGDSDHFVNQASQQSPDRDDDGGLVMKPLPISDQSGEQSNSEVNDSSRSVPFVSHQRTLSDEEILDSKSTLLYRLTRDAQQNLL